MQLLHEAINTGVTSSLVTDMLVKEPREVVRGWFASNRHIFPKSLVRPERYAQTKLVFDAIKGLEDELPKLPLVNVKTLDEYVIGLLNSSTAIPGVHEITVACFIVKHFGVEVALGVKLGNTSEVKRVLYTLTAVTFKTGYFGYNTLVIAQELTGSQILTSILDLMVTYPSEYIIKSIHENLMYDLKEDKIKDDYLVLATIMYLLQLDYTTEQLSYTIKRVLYSIINTTSIVYQPMVAYMVSVLSVISEQKTRVVPRPLRESHPYYDTVCRIF